MWTLSAAPGPWPGLPGPSVPTALAAVASCCGRGEGDRGGGNQPRQGCRHRVSSLHVLSPRGWGPPPPPATVASSFVLVAITLFTLTSRHTFSHRTDPSTLPVLHSARRLLARFLLLTSFSLQGFWTVCAIRGPSLPVLTAYVANVWLVPAAQGDLIPWGNGTAVCELADPHVPKFEIILLQKVTLFVTLRVRLPPVPSSDVYWAGQLPRGAGRPSGSSLGTPPPFP